MKITKIDLIPVKIPLLDISEGGISPYKRSRTAKGRTDVKSLIFRLETNKGFVGWGEMHFDKPFSVVNSIIKEIISPVVLNKSPFDINNMLRKVDTGERAELNARALFAGIEVACWDLMGKEAQKPIYELLGGKIRDSIEIAYCVAVLDIENTKKKVKQIKEEGYTTIKTKGGESIEFDIERARAIREAAGSNFDFRVDINQRYNPPQALRYIKGVEEFDLQYIEQPIPTNMFGALNDLRKRVKTPLAINEDCYIPNNLFSAIKQDSIDLAVVDYEHLGGISSLVKTAHIAEEAGLPLAHHCSFDMGIKTAAILHATSTLSAFSYPMDSTYFAHADDILINKIEIENGRFMLPKGIGLGIEVDEDKLSRYSI